MIPRWYRSRAHAFLFFSLLGTMVAAPILSGGWLGGAVFEIFLGINLAAAVLGLQRLQGRGFYMVTLLVVIGVRIARNWLPAHFYETIALFVLAAIAVTAAIKTARFAFGAKRVDGEHIFAALSAYLLAGIFLGLAHFGVEEIAPGSYAASRPGPPFGAGGLPGVIYFSFVTLATLGYGDIVPVSPTAQGLAVFEAVSGQLYLAVLVARLVGIYTKDTRE